MQRFVGGGGDRLQRLESGGVWSRPAAGRKRCGDFCAQALLRRGQRQFSRGDDALGQAAGNSLLVGCFAGRGLRALPGVERVIEGLPEVALGGRFAGSLQRGLGGSEFRGGVLGGAGGAGRGDGAFGLIHFLLWRRGAPREGGQDEGRAGGTQHGTHRAGTIGHAQEYTEWA